jgi:hypothetical protein
VEIDWIHRQETLNVCFNALDRHVVHGHADRIAFAGERELTFALLLEEVAALGGVLRSLGTGLGSRVESGLPEGREGLVVALATARLGALHVLDASAGAVVRVAGEELCVEDWGLLMRAGRTDPAPCAEVPASAPAYSSGGQAWTVLEVLTQVPTAGPAWPIEAVRRLVTGGTVTMDR